MKIQKKRLLGRTGFEVTELGFGAWPIGGIGYGPINERNAIECAEAYLDAGGNFIDTARRYGQSEAIIGKTLHRKNMRNGIFISTKTFKGELMETIPDIRLEIEQSLRFLQTDYVDIYYLHMPPVNREVMNRALDEFEALKSDGKIRAIGASIKGPAVTTATVDLCKKYINTGRVDVIQIVYSILRQANAEIFDCAYKKGVAIVARTAIESGFLSGKYRPGDVISEGHRKRWPSDTQEKIFRLVNELQNYAVRAPYRSLVQVAIRFALEPKEISCVIAGARNASQMRENMEVVSLPPLDDERLQRLRRDFHGMTEAYNPAMDTQ